MTSEQNDLIINNINVIHKALIDKGILDEDTHAEAMLYICENIGKYDPNKSQFSTFIYLSINNMLVKKRQSKHYNKRKIHSEYMYSFDYGIDGKCYLKDMIADEEDYIKDFEINDTIKYIKNKLKDNELIVFDLLLKGYKLKEIAKEINCTTQNVSLIKNTIAKKVRKEIYECRTMVRGE